LHSPKNTLRCVSGYSKIRGLELAEILIPDVQTRGWSLSLTARIRKPIGDGISNKEKVNVSTLGNFKKALMPIVVARSRLICR